MDNEENIKTGADNGAQEAPDSQQGKTFTQEEVNAIIQSRLSREKEKNAAENAAALAEREAQLHERELKLQLCETLVNNELPKEFCDIIKLTDEKSINTAVELLNRYIKKPKKTGGFKIGASDPNDNKNGEDPYRQVMGLE